MPAGGQLQMLAIDRCAVMVAVSVSQRGLSESASLCLAAAVETPGGP